jgi:hypothetical protein
MTNGQGRLMATQILFNPVVPAVPFQDHSWLSNLPRALAVLLGLFLCSIPAHAQLQQPSVFAADPLRARPSYPRLHQKRRERRPYTRARLAFSQQSSREQFGSRFQRPLPVRGYVPKQYRDVHH